MAAGVFSNLVVFTSTGGNASYTVIGRAASAPWLLVLTTDGNDFTFSFDTVPGLNYLVQFKDSLDDLSWQTEQSVPGDGTRKTVTHSVSAPGAPFLPALGAMTPEEYAGTIAGVKTPRLDPRMIRRWRAK